MIDLKSEILKATSGGLDIIIRLYPNANKNKHFCQGSSDKNPSAILKEFNGEWKIINYGEDGHAQSAIDCYMRETGYTFKEALYRLCEEYHVNFGLREEINRPKKFEIIYAPEDAKAGDFQFEEQPFTENDLLVWGGQKYEYGKFTPIVTERVLKMYDYVSLKWYKYTYAEKDKEGNLTGKLKQKCVTCQPDYPVYMHKCGDFAKIYTPLDINKANRFFYVGNKDPKYINGLDRLIADRKGAEERLDNVLICSGERDAINAASLGYYVLWFNSETSQLISEELYSKLIMYAKNIVNIPDIDETGIRVAFDLARRFLWLKTLILPDKLKTFRDNRGKPRKDLRDYLEIWPSSKTFSALVNNALCARFWDWIEKGNKLTCSITTTNLLYFLKIHGFYKFKDPASGVVKYIQIKDYIVTEYTSKEIRDYVRRQLVEMNIGTDVLETFLNSKKSTAAVFDDLDKIEISFDKADFESRTFFFSNLAIRVSENDIEYIRNKDISTYTWDKSIIEHNFRRLQPAFSVNQDNNMEFNHTKSNLMKVILNSSRIYWRNEYENDYFTEEENEKYKSEYKFSILGPRLTQEERQEQYLHFLNKIYAIGFLLHTYKLASRAKALWIMENKVTEEGESSGGSGKSFVIDALDKIGMLNIVTLEGRDKKLTENKHFMDRVNSSVDVLLIDDASEQLDFDRFYTMITNNITVNPKGTESFEIKFKEAPNLVFTSNFAPPRYDGSTKRRIIPLVYSDYYHIKTIDNDYLENRSITDDFGGRCLYDYDYTEEEYNADINFLIDCLQFYLRMARLGQVIEPPMENVIKRVAKREMGDLFTEWATEYFIIDGRLDKPLIRSQVYDEYLSWLGIKGKPKNPNNFRKAIKNFCEFQNWEFNPPSVKGYNGQGRILRSAMYNGVYKTWEFIYLHDKTKEINNE